MEIHIDRLKAVLAGNKSADGLPVPDEDRFKIKTLVRAMQNARGGVFQKEQFEDDLDRLVMEVGFLGHEVVEGQ